MKRVFLQVEIKCIGLEVRELIVRITGFCLWLVTSVKVSFLITFILEVATFLPHDEV